MRGIPPSASLKNAGRVVAAFTLIEMLVVLAIIGLLAAVGLPALKGFGKSNAIVAADRQVLDDMAAARQHAIAEHTTVYVVFMGFATPTNSALTNLFTGTSALRSLIPQVTNLLQQQYSSYALYTERNVGDQPGNHSTNYLTAWKTLPEGMVFATNKFWSTTNGVSVFQYKYFYFPTVVTNGGVLLSLPYIAFNYLGQLTTNRDNGGETLPLGRASIFYDASFKPDIIEVPPGNSQNSMSNHIFIDGLTGRARVQQQDVQ